MNTEYYFNGTEWVEREVSTHTETETANFPKETVLVTKVDGSPRAYSYYLGKDGYYHEKTQDGLSYMEAGGTYPSGYNPSEHCKTTTVAHTSVTPDFYNPFVNRNCYGEICQYKTDNILIAVAALVIVTCHIIGLVAFLRRGKK